MNILYLIFILAFITAVLVMLEPKIDKNNITGKWLLWYNTSNQKRKYIIL